MVNHRGVDVNYVSEKLKLILRDLDHYTPDELYRELGRLRDTLDVENNIGEES